LPPPDFQRNPYNVYDDLRETVKEWNPAIPESLRALARIRHFNLFVSTTFDDLLERALNEERFDGKEKTEVIAYSPKNVPRDERIANQMATGRPVIFQCFGTYKKSIDFALTQGDMVEYVHALQTLNHQPKGIFSELYDRSLLLLGNSFPDWLMRIFLRMARNSSLDYRDVPKQIVVDLQTQNDPLLRFYLRNFTTNTELIEEPGPVEFIEELYRRWSERFGTQETLEPTASAATENAMSPYAVFISYCRTDYFGESTRDRAKLVERYPTRHYEFSDPYIQMGSGGNSAYVTFSFTYRYSGSKPARGSCHVALTAERNSGTWLITEYDEKVNRQ
jgi:hypothetical protein